MARLHARRTAVVDGDSCVTYGELAARADGVAVALAARAPAPGTPVVLLLEQGVANIVATLGALGAGMAYAPLDPADPPAHLARLADVLATPVVLADARTADRAAALRAPGRDVVRVDRIAPAPAGPAVPLGPDALASVYFTSGTTGGAKGVMDSHANLVDNAARYTRTLRIGPADRLSLVQSPAFSGAASSMFAALLNGAALVPIPAAGAALADVAAAIRTRRVTVYHSVPSLLRSIVAVDGGTFPDVRVVRLEGDRAAPADAVLHRRHFPPGCVLANGLGTTETGLCRQLRLRAGDPVPEGVLPVGGPVPGVDVAVVDDDGAPLPPGAVGEIAVTGRRLAIGYWERPDLTAAAFSADPRDPGLRTYRTGDLGRMDADGTLALLGRRDGGLKVGGRRVEPAEVEAHLLAIPGVVEAAVTTYAGRRGEGRLAAYLVVDGTGPGHVGIRELMLARVPAAMVPATFVFVASLPLTASGKLDRAALVPAAPPADGRAPTADEAALLALWEEVLERPGIGLDDDFIACGGDSLAAAELLAALEERAGRALPDGLLVRAPTVARMAAALRGEAPGAPAPGLVPLQPLGRGTPLVVAHGADFSTNTYAWLVRALGMGRPVWGLDAPPGGEASVAAIADGHADALEAACPDGRVLLAGFCSGGVVALEVARRLRARGADVALVALIGVGGADFPGLLAPAALARWRASRPGVPVRHRIGRIVRPERLQVTFRGHRPARLPGAASLFLSGPGAGRYSDDPSADWAGLAERTEVVLLAGDDDGLMHEPGVAELTRALSAAMDAADAGG